MSTQCWNRLRFTSAEWYVVPEWQDVLFDDIGLRWREWQAKDKVHLVKGAPHRRIYRIEVCRRPTIRVSAGESYQDGPKSIYIKCYPLAGFRRIAELLRLSDKGREECDKFLYLLQQGIATVQPVACGRDGEAVYVVTIGLENTMPLDRWLLEKFPRLPYLEQQRLRPILPRLLARVIAKLHCAGAYHRDLHAGNLLIRYRAGREPEIFLTDAHEVRLGRPLSWRRACRNLTFFGCWFLERTQPVDRRRFLRAYVQARGDLLITRQQERSAARQLERFIWRSLLRSYRRRDSKLWSQNRYCYFWRSPNVTNTPLGAARWYAWAVNDLPVAALEQIVHEASSLLPPYELRRCLPLDSATSTLNLAGPQQPDDGKQSVPGIPSDNSSATAPIRCWRDRGRRGGFWETVLNVGGQQVPVLVKCFRLTSWRLRLAEGWRLGPASCSWQNAYCLAQRDFLTPRVLALFHVYRGLFPVWALLVLEKGHKMLDLRQAFTQLGQGPAREALRRHWRLIEAVAKLIARLHRHGFSHRDLKAAHILMHSDELERDCLDSGLWLVDLVGLSSPLMLSRRRRVQNLARLEASFHYDATISRTDRMRFLRAYLPNGLRERQEWKRWWREIALAAQRKILRNQEQNRPLT